MSQSPEYLPKELWTLSAKQLVLLTGMSDQGSLSFAVQLKFMELHGRFPEHHGEIPTSAVARIASQLGVCPEIFTKLARIFHERP